MRLGLRQRKVLVVLLLVSHALGALGQAPKSRRPYASPYVFGLYYVVSSKEWDGRALVISRDGKPISPKENEPDAPTQPGFYLSYEQHLPFERIEFIRNELRFKTVAIGGVRFEFYGIAKAQIDPEFDAPIFRIKGLLKKFRNEKLVSAEKITFGHAVIY